MPKFQIITDQKSIERYGGSKMYFAPPIDYDEVMKKIPYGKVITVGKIREYFAELSGADFTEPITAGIFVSIVAWASYQRSEDETPYWRTLKANGELNAKYPNGIEAQKEKLEAEGHAIIQKGRKNIGKTVDFKREIDCLFLLQKFKYKQLSNMVVAFFDWRNLKMNDKNFIEELRQKREEYGVTQTRLAVACGISREYYNRIEKGKQPLNDELREVIEKQIERFNPQEPGETLYLGSTSSELYMCAYQKNYEQYVKNGTEIEDTEIKNRFEIRMKNERAYYAVVDLLTYRDAERTAFSIINHYVRFVDREDDKPKSQWITNDDWAWFVGENREPIRLTTKPEPYTLQKALHWLQRQVAPTIKMVQALDRENRTTILKDMIEQAELKDKHKHLLQLEKSTIEERIDTAVPQENDGIF